MINFNIVQELKDAAIELYHKLGRASKSSSVLFQLWTPGLMHLFDMSLKAEKALKYVA